VRTTPPISRNGTASIDLRGFGANRTLVLVNGKRFVPTNENGTVDISAFPAGLLKRVDLITGGASAVYGSDAITGVVNFVLNDDFEGFQLDGSYKETIPYYDGKTYSFDVLGGTKYADDRGHMMVYANYTNRAAILEAARPYTSVVYRDGTINGLPHWCWVEARWCREPGSSCPPPSYPRLFPDTRDPHLR